MSSKWLYHSQRWYKQQLVVQRYYMNKDKHIPQGYKNSPLGIIPKEWEVKRLGDVCDYVDYRGKSPNKSSEGIFLITAKNIREGHIDYDVSKEYIPEEDYAEVMRRGKAEVGDVLITTEAPLGHVAQIDTPYVALAQRVIKYRGKEVIENTFLKYFLMSEIFQKILIANATGSTALGIKGSRLHQLPIIIPSITEQTIITTILCLWDTAIEKQSELIEKLTLRKSALMQQLLTGKKRLPGFSGKWQEKKLRGIGIFLSNNTLSREQLNISSGDVHCIHYGDVLIKYPSIIDCEKETMPFINENAYKESMIDFIENGDIIISDTAEDETVGKTCEIQNVGNKKILAGLHTMLLRPNKGLFAPCFLGYYINSEAYHKKLIPLIQGIKVCSIGKKAIQNTTIAIPPLEEQKAIASVLVKADKEIELAKEKLASLQTQKRGLMQQLLTGKKRVV